MELPEDWEFHGRHWNTKSRAYVSTNTGSESFYQGYKKAQVRWPKGGTDGLLAPVDSAVLIEGETVPGRN
jgi:hypothetical protein